MSPVVITFSQDEVVDRAADFIDRRYGTNPNTSGRSEDFGMLIEFMRYLQTVPMPRCPELPTERVLDSRSQ